MDALINPRLRELGQGHARWPFRFRAAITVYRIFVRSGCRSGGLLGLVNGRQFFGQTTFRNGQIVSLLHA